MKATVSDCRHYVTIDDGSRTSVYHKQEAYELHERIGAILPKLVQPFDSVELDPAPLPGGAQTREGKPNE